MAEQKEKKKRTRSGCLNCRRRRRKCDETKPTCLNCSKRNETCQRGVKLNFRKENAQTIEDHGELEENHPLEQERSHKRAKRFEIVNVTGNVVGRYNHESKSRDTGLHTSDDSLDPGTWRNTAVFQPPSDGNWPSAHTTVQTRAAKKRHQEHLVTPTDNSDLSSDFLGQTNPISDVDPRTASLSSPELYGQASRSDGITSISPNTTTSTVHNPTESAAQNLLFLRQMQNNLYDQAPISTPYTTASFDLSPEFANIDQITPESFNEDGVFLPGSTYQELHATLRQHLIDETNSNSQSREHTPLGQGRSLESRPFRQTVQSRLREQIDDEDMYSDNTPPLELSDEEEYRLWKNWVDEISGWLDKFDNQRHFRHTLPIIAQTCDHLKFSMLAVSARQIELKHSSKPTDQSLALYQQAIHLLLPQLHTRSTPVIASCVVLCVLEMLSCSPKAWRRHLDGCANLMRAVGITGFSGGVEQALFWCFARMDVCGGLIDSLKTLIPVDEWASKIDMDADVGLFRTSTSFDTYANHAVYLCAQVVVLLSEHRDRHAQLQSKSFADKWLKIWRYVQDWKIRRPAEMKPVATISSASLTPFPTILYSSPAATSGNQMHHTACILLLQSKPVSIRLDPKPQSIQWHARQICGISLSHDDHGAWTNSIQPLWIAGKCMSRHEEQVTILDHLRKIEKESGWGTRWRMQDLQDYWDIEYG